MHPHRNRGLELVLVEQGHLEWQVETRPESLYPGSLFFTLPWQAHGSRLIREPENRIYYFLLALPDENPASGTLHFPEALNCTPQETEFISRALLKNDCHTRTAPPFVRNLFKELVRELESEQPESDVICAALLKTLLLQSARLFNESATPDKTRWSSSQRVSDLIARLPEKLEEQWTLNRMAAQCGIKRTRFSKIVFELTGYTPTAFLNRLRFETACGLLLKTGKQITEIAFECGYSSSQYFASQFKKESGLTPAQYRRMAPDLESILSLNWQHPEERTLEEEQKRQKTMHTKKADD